MALQGILSRAAALSPRFARCRVGENSPPDCFLPQAFACSLLVRIPCTIKKEEQYLLVLLSFGALQGIRTPDLLVRSQTLYPAELAAHFLMLRYYITTAIKNQVFFKLF